MRCNSIFSFLANIMFIGTAPPTRAANQTMAFAASRRGELPPQWRDGPKAIIGFAQTGLAGGAGKRRLRYSRSLGIGARGKLIRSEYFRREVRGFATHPETPDASHVIGQDSGAPSFTEMGSDWRRVTRSHPRRGADSRVSQVRRQLAGLDSSVQTRAYRFRAESKLNQNWFRVRIYSAQRKMKLEPSRNNGPAQSHAPPPETLRIICLIQEVAQPEPPMRSCVFHRQQPRACRCSQSEPGSSQSVSLEQQSFIPAHRPTR